MTEDQELKAMAEAMEESYNLGVAAYAGVGPLVASKRPFRELPYLVRQAWIKAVWELKEACREAAHD
jgi:hypothetical protein